MTPNMKVVYDYVKEVYGRRIGVTNCRPIAGSVTWSQHSWSNANDIYVSDKNLGDKIVNDLYDKFGEHVRYMLWWRSRHYNHIHVDMWPYGLGQPPCSGGTLRVKNKDGTYSNAFSHDLKGDYNNMAGLQVIDLQKALNKAGQLGANGFILSEDDIYGPNTAHALAMGLTSWGFPEQAVETLAELAHDRLDKLKDI